MQTQYSFSGFKTSTAFGGSLLKDKKNRTARPLSTKKSMHLMLKSSHLRGDASLFRAENAQLFLRVLNKYAEKYFVVIEKYKLVGNHVHILIRLKSFKLYQDFIRSLTGQFALMMIQKFNLKVKRFFDERPFTRVVEYGRDLRQITAYIHNQLKKKVSVPEAVAGGAGNQTPRTTFLIAKIKNQQLRKMRFNCKVLSPRYFTIFRPQLYSM